MIVVDTNVVAHLYLTSDRSEEAERALRRDPEWAAPWLWRSELANVLATQVRLERLALADASAILSAALDRLGGRELLVAPERALALAAESGCSAYDCEFAAAAIELGVPLVTVDRALLRAFPEVAVSLEDFAGD